MKLKNMIRLMILVMGIQFTQTPARAHEIFFCGERIPLSNQVSQKLMDIIKKQIFYGVLSQRRLKSSYEMIVIEDMLRQTNLPNDIKYLAIVESGLQNVVSPVGAAGPWQLMRETAIDWGLSLSPYDERNDLQKATHAACQELARTYNFLKKKYGVRSWVLTAAAYNVGGSRIYKELNYKQQSYFEMDLNKETAEYVYKIIAVKELFEYPELYIKDFGFNVFNSRSALVQPNPKDISTLTDPGFSEMKVDLQNSEDPAGANEKKNNVKQPVTPKNVKERFIMARISGNYPDFKDSTVVSVELDNDLIIDGNMTSKGEIIKGAGWIIDGKVFIDFGYGKKLLLMDITTNAHDGIMLSNLLDKTEIMLKITEFRN